MNTRPVVIFFLCCLFSMITARAQVGPPTLTAGIGSIVYERGRLDAELIAAAISQKQSEIQSELAQRYILNSLECGSFALWNYVRQNLEILFRESDPEVMTKEILRYGAEMALSYGMAEYFLQDLAAKAQRRELTPSEEKFLLFYFYWMDDESKRALGAFLPDADHNLDQCIDKFLGTCSSGAAGELVAFEDYVMVFLFEGQERQNYFEQVEDQLHTFSLRLTLAGRDRLRQMATGRPEILSSQLREASSLRRGLFLPRPEFLSLFKNTGDDFNEDVLTGLFTEKCGNISPNHLLLDLAFEVVRGNEVVQRAGFFQDIGVSPEAYRVRNKYLLLAEQMNLFLPIDEIKTEMENITEVIFRYFKTLAYLREGGLELNLATIDNLLAETPALTVAEIQRSILDVLSNLSTTLKVKHDFDPQQRAVLDDLLTIVRDRNITADEFDSYAYFIEVVLIPQMVELNFATRGAFDVLLQEAELLAQVMRGEALLIMRGLVQDERVSQGIVEFIQLIDLLNNLDQVETYDYIFKFLVDIGNLTSSERARTIINAIANGVDRYLVIDQQENLLQLEVTAFANDIFERFGERTGSRFSFYFSVGLNNAFAPVTVAESFFDSTQHIYYASEKVGIKYKIFDWRRKYAYGDFDLDAEESTGRLRRKTALVDRQPVISDVYAFATLSGLLYQVEVLRSVDSFNDPTVNLGFGAAFFNDLDLNLTYTVPFGRRFFNEGLINIGLDIKITEYIGRLREKQRCNCN